MGSGVQLILDKLRNSDAADMIADEAPVYLQSNLVTVILVLSLFWCAWCVEAVRALCRITKFKNSFHVALRLSFSCIGPTEH